MANESISFSFGADTRGMTDALDGLLGKLAGLAAAFLSAQAVIQAFGEAIDLGGRLNDLSTRTGETAGNLALLERAFENTSVGADKVGPAIAKMQVALTNFADGSKEAVETFAALGLSLEDLQNRSPTEQLQIIGEALAAVGNNSERAALAVKIFGRSGTELLPVLTNFSAEIGEARSQLGSLPEMLDRTAAEIDSLGDNLAAIKNKGIEMAYGFLSEVVPAVDALAGKLAGLDAAGIGAGLADALVGAFAAPMKAAELLADTLNYGVKVMGNEMVFQIRYWAELLFNTFAQIGTSIIPVLGNNMLGALQIAAGGFGEALLGVIDKALKALEPIAEALGFGDQMFAAISSVQTLQDDAQQMMVEGFAKIAEGSQIFEQAFERAKASSTVIREDIFGAKEASEQMVKDFEEIQQTARDTMDQFRNPEGSSATAAGRTESGSGVDPLINSLIQENFRKTQQTTVVVGGGGGGGGGGMTAAQQAAANNRALQLLAGAPFGTAAGRSASAQRALDLQGKLALLTAAAGPEPTPAQQQRLDRLQSSLQGATDRALGISLSGSDREEALQFARDFYNAPGFQNLSFDDLVNLKQKEILQRKEDALGTNDLLKKNQQDKQAEQTKQAGQQPQQEKQQNTILGIAQQLLKLMQQVEPRIPVSNLV